ncbi:hypothetical protein BKA80DRAFT_7030 [Phyllosticta citrichinensis]
MMSRMLNVAHHHQGALLSCIRQESTSSTGPSSSPSPNAPLFPSFPLSTPSSPRPSPCRPETETDRQGAQPRQHPFRSSRTAGWLLLRSALLRSAPLRKRTGCTPRGRARLYPRFRPGQVGVGGRGQDGLPCWAVPFARARCTYPSGVANTTAAAARLRLS